MDSRDPEPPCSLRGDSSSILPQGEGTLSVTLLCHQYWDMAYPASLGQLVQSAPQKLPAWLYPTLPVTPPGRGDPALSLARLCSFWKVCAQLHVGGVFLGTPILALSGTSSLWWEGCMGTPGGRGEGLLGTPDRAASHRLNLPREGAVKATEQVRGEPRVTRARPAILPLGSPRRTPRPSAPCPFVCPRSLSQSSNFGSQRNPEHQSS